MRRRRWLKQQSRRCSSGRSVPSRTSATTSSPPGAAGRMHGGRKHSCATLMTLAGIPAVVVLRGSGHRSFAGAQGVRPLTGRGAQGRRTSSTVSCHRRVTEGCSNTSNREPAGQTGADDGNRTRVFSLGSCFGASTPRSLVSANLRKSAHRRSSVLVIIQSPMTCGGL